jgi:hypothetical protein
VQQFTQSYRPRLMRVRAHGHFDGVQIQPAIVALVLPDHLRQTAYFAPDFLLDGFGFFFCGVKPSSRGRNWQILSLTAISC